MLCEAMASNRRATRSDTMQTTAITSDRGRTGPRGFTTTFALAVVALTALATTLMLEATRVFLSYTVFVVDQSKRVELALIAVAIFLAFGLSAVVVKMMGARSAVV